MTQDFNEDAIESLQMSGAAFLLIVLRPGATKADVYDMHMDNKAAQEEAKSVVDAWLEHKAKLNANT